MRSKLVFCCLLLLFLNSSSIFSQDVIGSSSGCVPFTVKFTGAAGNWDFGDGSPVVTMANPSHTYTSASTFTVLYNGSSIPTQILVNPSPVVKVDKIQKICFNSSTKLNGSASGTSAPYTFLWSQKDSLTDLPSSSSPNTKKLGRTTKFILTVTDLDGCSAKDSTTVLINPLVAMAGQSVEVCNATVFTPAYSVVGGHGALSTFNYSWTPSAGISNSTTDKPVFKISNPSTSAQTYTTLFTVSDSIGCKATSVFTYKVRPRFKFSNFTDIQLCLGTWSNSNGSVSNAQGSSSSYTYSWSPSTNISSTFIVNPSFRGAGLTIYKLVVIDSLKCKDSTTMTVSIFNPINISAGSSQTVCYNNTVKLNGSVTGGVAPTTYFWSPGTRVVDTTSLTSETRQLQSTDSVYLTAIDSKGCVQKTGILLTVDIPTPTAITSPDVCSNDPIKLKVNVSGGLPPFKYIWKLSSSNVTLGDNDGLVDADVNDSIANPSFIPIKEAGQVIYSVVVKDRINCFSPQKALETLNVRPIPIFEKKKDYIFCFEDANVLTLVADTGYAKYQWFNGADTRRTDVTKDGTYTYVATDKYGCFATDVINVVSKCSPRIYLPNAFTPNGDGENDLYQFYGRYYRDASMKIFNRWGEFIFLINKDTPTWDGNVNGKPVEPGAYTYIIQYSGVINDDVFIKQGVINLIR